MLYVQQQEKYNLLQEISIDMFDTPFEYDARELHRSLTSFKKDEKAIIEIIITRPRSHLILVQKIMRFQFLLIVLMK